MLIKVVNCQKTPQLKIMDGNKNRKTFFKSYEVKEMSTITIQKQYFIEKKMILMMGEYDSNGKLCTRVMAEKTSFLVDRTPLQLLNDNLTYIGFNLDGPMKGAKAILGKRNKCPVIVNPYLGICLFPDKSPNKADCILFNPEHIVKTTAIRSQTLVEFSNGHSIIVDCKLSAFNHKIETAKQLLRISKKRAYCSGSVIFYLDPPKEKSGTYNFKALEEDQK